MVSQEDVEEGSPSPRSSSNIINHLVEEVTQSWGDVVLLICCFHSGLLDAAVFNVWSCFVSMQTGNTIYTGLGVSAQPVDQPYRWVKSLTSIISYTIGCYVFSRIQRLCGPLRRGTLFGSFAAQSLLCFIPAILEQTEVVPDDAGFIIPDNLIVLLPLSMLAFQAGGQTVMSRVLGFNEIPTVVLTSTYCDLAFDPQLLTAAPAENVKRNRRVVAVIMMFLGATAGGFLTKGGNLANTLWISGALKGFLALVWMFWSGKGAVRLE